MDELCSNLANVSLDKTSYSLYMNQSCNELSYDDVDKYINTTNIHRGQRKLQLVEMAFLNRDDVSDEGLIVYAGSSPGSHIATLIELYPKFKFLLIDTVLPNIRNVPITYLQVNSVPYKDSRRKVHHYTGKTGNILSFIDIPFNIANITYIIANAKPKSVFMYQGYMTTAFAIELARIKEDVYFWSDIRTSYCKDVLYGSPSDADILLNSAQQLAWITIMKPKLSMLKLRPPFYFEQNDVTYKEQLTILEQNRECLDFCYEMYGLDFINMFKNKTFTYIEGEILLQPWTNTTSTETRLIIGPQLLFTHYNLCKYRAITNYWNSVSRRMTYPTVTSSIEGYLCQCGDCYFEHLVVEQYNNKFKTNLDIRAGLCPPLFKTVITDTHPL